MQPQIRAEICPKCKGQGKLAGKACDYCRGVGGIGTDGVNEYYLEHDGKGNVRVIGIRQSARSQSYPSAQTDTPPTNDQNSKKQRGRILKGLLLIVLIIFYIGFLGVYITILKDMKVLVVVTIIAFGFLMLILLYNTPIVEAFVNIITKIIIKEPNDYLSAIRKRKNENAR